MRANSPVPVDTLACPSAGGSRRPAIGVVGAGLTIGRRSFVAID